MSAETPSSWRGSGLPWLAVTLLSIIVDQITKFAIVRRFDLLETVTVLPVLQITRAHNTGAAWSWLRPAAGSAGCSAASRSSSA
jgi:signal peptidase II